MFDHWTQKEYEDPTGDDINRAFRIIGSISAAFRQHWHRPNTVGSISAALAAFEMQLPLF